MDVRDLLKFGGGSIKLTSEEKISFKIEAQEVIVTFNSNSSEEIPNTTQTRLVGFPYGTFPTLTRTGYDFIGWNTASNGTGTSLNESSIVTIQSNHSVFAQWQIIFYSITYILNGGEFNPNPSTFTVLNLQPSLTLAAASRTGYSFDEWSINPITTIGNKTVSASWVANNYSVTLNRNGGSGGTTAVFATFDSPMPTATAPTRTGYFFNGYFLSSVQYYTSSMASARNWDIPNSATLTASWVPNTYIIAFNGNGGTGTAPSNINATYDQSYQMPANTFTRAGYTFGGWNTNTSGTGTTYAAGTSYSNLTSVNGATVTLYARWIANSYTIFFSPEAGSVDFADAVFDSPMPTTGTNNAEDGVLLFPPITGVTITAPTLAGFTFNGYFLSGVVYYNANMTSARNWDRTSSETLTASWIANTYTVTFDKQGGTDGSNSVIATFNANMPSASAPTRSGYTFGGYYTGTNGSGTQYYTSAMASARTWNIAANTTLYARWTANTYTVTLDHQGGTSSLTTVTATFDSVLPSLSQLPSRSGFIFNGYFALPGGGAPQYYTPSGSGNAVWNVPNNAIIYAYWVEDTGGGGGCLAPDTPIVMEDGTVKRLDEVYVGDRVRSYIVNGMIDEDDPNWIYFITTSTDGEYSVSTVKQVDKDWFKEYYIINNDIKITKQHELFAKDSELNIWGWIEAPNLKVGDQLFGVDGNPVTITSIVFVPERLDVITINVEETDTYFVGNTPVLVHNREFGKID